MENLFHPSHDTVAGIEKDDLQWTPDGEKKWTFAKYNSKVENIARVLTNIGEWEGVDIIGLQEVENVKCLKKICYTLRKGEYDFVHYESPDRRGIDVAFIYKKTLIDIISSRVLPVPLINQTTRDILYVCANIDNKDTIHFFVCHLPSMRGGKKQSEWKRQQAKSVLQSGVDSVYAINPNAKIIIMGDMNKESENDINGMKNIMQSSHKTHFYKNIWSCLDQFYISPNLENSVQAKVYNEQWLINNQYSDHLPIILKFKY